MKNHADTMIFHTAICEKNFSSLERSQIALMADEKSYSRISRRRRRTKRSGMEDLYDQFRLFEKRAEIQHVF